MPVRSQLFGYSLGQEAADSGADLLWRKKISANLPCNERLGDGSYLSKIYRSDKDRRHERNGRVVRVIEYTLDGDKQQSEIDDTEPLYRLKTTILEAAAPSYSEARRRTWYLRSSMGCFWPTTPCAA